MDFIYTHELPDWHRAMSPNLSPETINILSDKASFANKMRELGLPVIDGRVLMKGKFLAKKQLFLKSSMFLKPLRGSNKKDAYKLKYNDLSNIYTLSVSENKQICTQDMIMLFIQQLVTKQDYLIQPMAQNHKALQAFSSFEALITFRLITVWTGSKSQVISAVIELPVDEYSNRAFTLPIDILHGVILPVEETVFSFLYDQASTFKHIIGHKVIYWQEMVDIVKKAHSCFSDLFSVGWDIAITTDGVRLIEGNINWAVDPHQVNKPLLMPGHILYARPDIVSNSNIHKI